MKLFLLYVNIIMQIFFVFPHVFTEIEGVLEMVDTFLNTDFEGGRHQNRINKIQPC